MVTIEQWSLAVASHADLKKFSWILMTLQGSKYQNGILLIIVLNSSINFCHYIALDGARLGEVYLTRIPLVRHFYQFQQIQKQIPPLIPLVNDAHGPFLDFAPMYEPNGITKLWPLYDMIKFPTKDIHNLEDEGALFLFLASN